MNENIGLMDATVLFLVIGLWVIQVKFIPYNLSTKLDLGHGRPVDELDTVCKAYKDCLKCARWAYGDTCIGEFRKYKFGIRRGEVTCRSKVSKSSVNPNLDSI